MEPGFQGPSALWSLGGSATELLFDAGQRHALTDEAKHAYEAQVSGYKGVIFLAFEDVEDQLSGLRILEQESSAEQKAVDSAWPPSTYPTSDTRAASPATLKF